MNTVVYLIRHSEHVRKGFGDYYVLETEKLRNERVILSVNGERKAKILSRDIEFQNVDIIYSSHYVRAISTAKYIAERNNLKLNIDETFGERIFGKNTNEDIPENFNKLQFLDWNYKLENGESFNEVKERMTYAFNNIYLENKFKKIVIVSHGSAILTLLKNWCEISYNIVDSSSFDIFFGNELIFNGYFSAPEVFKLVFNESDSLVNIENIKINNILLELIEKYNLGELVDIPVKVTGGLTHTTYKVKTSKKTYIVKLLNPNIMKRSTALENFMIADEFEKILINNEIKMLPAIQFDDQAMIKIEDQYLYVFDFFEGKSLSQENIKTKHCKLIAKELAKIHNIEIKEKKFIREEINVDWNFYLNLAKEKNLEIYNLLVDKIDLLNKSMSNGNKDIKNVPAFTTICHNDMDSKNILWKNDEFKIIDLECLCYSNPLIEFFSLALCWSGYEECNVDFELLETFIKTYFDNIKIDLKNIEWEVLYNVNYGRLEWLEFNLKRSFLIDCNSKEEQEIGINEVKETLEHVVYYDSIKNSILKIFNSLI